MTGLIPFDYSGRQVRVLTIDDEPWFVGRDVTTVLGYRTTNDGTRWLDEDERDTHWVRTPGGDQEMVIVSEPGLYSLILRSKRPEAKAFKRWVTHEVLPSIRKNGGYISASATADQLDTLVKQAAVLQALNGLADKGWLDAKARILGARALGETPHLDQATKPLTVSIYLTRKGLKGRELKAAASMFGKRLKALFVESYGEEPPVIEDVVGRHVVNVAQYQEQHSHLFDRIWSKYYGGAA